MLGASALMIEKDARERGLFAEGATLGIIDTQSTQLLS
jgi:hypothetical protein